MRKFGEFVYPSPGGCCSFYGHGLDLAVHLCVHDSAGPVFWEAGPVMAINNQSPLGES